MVKNGEECEEWEQDVYPKANTNDAAIRPVGWGFHRISLVSNFHKVSTVFGFLSREREKEGFTKQLEFACWLSQK